MELLGGRRSLITSFSAFLQGGLDLIRRRPRGHGRGWSLPPREAAARDRRVSSRETARALRPLEVSPVSGETRDLRIVLPATASSRDHGRAQQAHRRRARASHEISQVALVPDIAHFREGGGVAMVEDAGEKQMAWVPPPAMSSLVSRLPVPTTLTAADGTFELAGVLPGLVVVAVDEPSHLVLMQSGVATGAAGGTRDLGTLVPGLRAVNGRVLDSAASRWRTRTLGMLRSWRPSRCCAARTARRPTAASAPGLPSGQRGASRAPTRSTSGHRHGPRHRPRQHPAPGAGAQLTLAVLDAAGAVVPDAALRPRRADEDIVDLLVAPHALPDVKRDEDGHYIVGGLAGGLEDRGQGAGRRSSANPST